MLPCPAPYQTTLARRLWPRLRAAWDPPTVQQAAHAGALPGPYRDPFRRLLIAQVLSRDLVLISNESTFDRYAIHRLW